MVRPLPTSPCCCCSLLWLLLCCCCLGTGVGGRWVGPQPEFGEAENTVKVQEGQTARLPCVVFHLNDRAVTWLRRRDLHILTTGHHTYSADDRFQVVHSPGSDQWTLVVTYAQLRDSGIYECQINTDPKLSRPVTLNVYDSSQPISVSKSKVFVANNTASTRDGHLRVEIQGPRELYIEEGSSLTLKCLVTSSYGPSTLVYWYHDTRLLDYSSPRGGIKLKIDHEKGETVARLVVEKVGAEDSGMYSCVPPGSHPASVRVHVHQGKQEAAIHQAGMNYTSSSSSLAPLSFLPYLLLLYLPTSPSSLAVLVVCVSASHANLPLLHVVVYITCLLLTQSTSPLLHGPAALHPHTPVNTLLFLLFLVCFISLYHSPDAYYLFCFFALSSPTSSISSIFFLFPCYWSCFLITSMCLVFTAGVQFFTSSLHEFLLSSLTFCSVSSLLHSRLSSHYSHTLLGLVRASILTLRHLLCSALPPIIIPWPCERTSSTPSLSSVPAPSRL